MPRLNLHLQNTGQCNHTPVQTTDYLGKIHVYEEFLNEPPARDPEAEDLENSGDIAIEAKVCEDSWPLGLELSETLFSLLCLNQRKM